MKSIISTCLLVTAAFANPFSIHNKSLGVTLGSGSVSYGSFNGSYTENYYILGVSADYYVYDNLTLGLGYRGWFGGSPLIHQGTVPLTYYIPTNYKFRPYLGAFYRYTYISDSTYSSYGSVGGRAGLAILFNNGYAGLGWIQEYRLNADGVSDTSSGYPEVVVGFSF